MIGPYGFAIPAQEIKKDAASDKWQCQIAAWRAASNLPAGLCVWANQMEATGMPRTERVKAIIEMVAVMKFQEMGYNLYTVQSMPFSQKRELLRDVYCDVSQNPQHKNCTNSAGISGCLATSTVLYSYRLDRIVLPVELAMIQGHRRGFQFPECVSSNQIRDLAGEGMALPCLGTIVWCMYLIKGLP